jgi:uncharacterized protein YjiS (DUF1127 family)
MRSSVQPQYVKRHATAESFGRIARCTPSATVVQLAAGRRVHSSNEASIAALSTTQLEPAARIEHARRVGEFAAMAWRAVASHLQKMVVRARQRHQARATYLALRDLDTRTLRDLGFDRSEILSVAAGLAGGADAHRAHVVLALRGPRD